MSRILFLFGMFVPSTLLATSSTLPGQELTLWWGLPFMGMLLSIALLPLGALKFWHAHYGKISFGFALITLGSLFCTFGFDVAYGTTINTLFHDYIPFIIMIGTLYTISGGICVKFKAPPSPLVNTGLLALGTGLAGWIGTTGASMLLIRPLIDLNLKRQYQIHPLIFFIFLVANIGGALTPLGDPPLFLGFLKGVDFFWPLKSLVCEISLVTFPLLGIFFCLDTLLMKKEGLSFKLTVPKVQIQGLFNGVFFLGVMALILLSTFKGGGQRFSFVGISFKLYPVLRDGGLMVLALLSYKLTPPSLHQTNHFSWAPLQEVAKLFFGIFITVMPVLAILDAGSCGSLAFLSLLIKTAGTAQNAFYFWLSGSLSAFLDNAPTYLVFFHMAGGNPDFLMTELTSPLIAISLGTVFMGALTYIGNAPNFMIKTIAESHHIRMPGFFGYMGWSATVLLPLFLLLTWLRF